MSEAKQKHASTLRTADDTRSSGDGSDLWYTLVHWNDLPHWQQDNQHIYSSYRQASYSYSRSLQSIFHWHNESVNIWSHLVPGTLALPLGAILYKILEPRYERASAGDVFAMSCFFVGAAFCLGISATYHAVSNHSPPVARMWNQFDYAGISLLIAGSFVPSVYYGFWCHPDRQWIYWSMVRQLCLAHMAVADEDEIGSLGIACTAVSVLPKFRTPAWRPYRAMMFVGMGISAVFPVLDGLKTFGLQAMEKQMGLSWLVLQGALYIFGAGLYAVSYTLDFRAIAELGRLAFQKLGTPANSTH